MSSQQNQGVLRYLARGDDPSTVEMARPSPETNTWRLGTHPDIVELLWTRLNRLLSTDARFLVADTAALVDTGSGLIVAVALGTQYAVLLTGAGLAAATDAGFETSHQFATVGRTLDLSEVFGPGWVFGRYDEREGGWLVETVAAANL